MTWWILPKSILRCLDRALAVSRLRRHRGSNAAEGHVILLPIVGQHAACMNVVEKSEQLRVWEGDGRSNCPFRNGTYVVLEMPACPSR